MNDDQLKNQIISFVKIAKISQEQKDKILTRLPQSTSQQLDAVHAVMMQQVIMDIYFDELEKFEKSENLLDETDLEEMYKTIVKKMDDTYSLVLTEAELNQIRSSLQSIQQSSQPPAAPVQSFPTPPVQPVVSSAVVSTPAVPKPIAPVVPVTEAPVSPVPPEV